MARSKRFLQPTLLQVSLVAIGLLSCMARASNAQTLPTQTLPAEGTYLFGEQPEADQLDSAYFVFTLQNNELIGAFYMPYSSFDCVQGRVQTNQIALQITDSYSQETYDYALALDSNTTVAGIQGGAVFNIEGYHQIPQVSDNDLRMLQTCQAFYGQ
jgi:hypothetical protein